MWLLAIALCVSSFIRVCPDMPTTYYLNPTQQVDGNTYGRLDLALPFTTDSDSPSVTGFNVSSGASFSFPDNTYTHLCNQTIKIPGVNVGFGGDGVFTPLPDSLQVGSCSYRSQKPLNGTFREGYWALNLRTSSATTVFVSGSATVKFRFTGRIYKSIHADGTSPIEISDSLLNSTPVTITSPLTLFANSQDFILQTLNKLAAVKFDNEYLFIEVALVNEHTHFTAFPVTFVIHLVFGPNDKLIAPVFDSINVISENVCPPFGQSEMYIYISPDGVQYPLDIDGRRAVLNDQGTGTPPIDYITQRGPFQHGGTLLAAYAQPRVVQLMILHKYDNRDSWWNGRANLLRQLSPRKQLTDGAVQTGVLRRILSTGEKRDLNCLIQEGPKFNPRGDNVWDELSYTEALRFIGFDPIYFDPTIRSYFFDKQGSQLTFPITFPITFTTIHQTTKLQYEGSWLAYPKFIITGPMTYVKLWNMTTDEVIEIIYDLDEGQIITIDLQYGSKTVLLDDGTNLLPYVTHNSQIGTFHLTETLEGVNQFHVHMVGVMAPSQIEMQYNPRYLGV